MIFALGLAVALPLRALRRGVTGVLPVVSMRLAGDSALPAHHWHLVNEKHWQLTSNAFEDPADTDAAEGNRGDCPVGMVAVAGTMKRNPTTATKAGFTVEQMQDSTCTDWLTREYPERCATYDREKWLSISSELPTTAMNFCIDRFEYPNVLGQNPVVMVEWKDAEALCTSKGKRICTETEWTFACEGEEASPYPIGYVRDADACVIDRPWIEVDERALQSRTTIRAEREVDRLWQGEPSGSHPACRSPFGVHDMAGNVDEWTRSSSRTGLPSIFKGGYWGQVRARCRPSTRSHGEGFAFYQQSFRCCADAPDSPPSTEVPDAPAAPEAPEPAGD